MRKDHYTNKTHPTVHQHVTNRRKGRGFSQSLTFLSRYVHTNVLR
jgi:hypothetical protein